VSSRHEDWTQIWHGAPCVNCDGALGRDITHVPEPNRVRRILEGHPTSSIYRQGVDTRIHKQHTLHPQVHSSSYHTQTHIPLIHSRKCLKQPSPTPPPSRSPTLRRLLSRTRPQRSQQTRLPTSLRLPLPPRARMTVKDNVFSMFGGGPAKIKKDEEDDANEPSGASKPKGDVRIPPDTL
jgi:hypothetical protein